MATFPVVERELLMVRIPDPVFVRDLEPPDSARPLASVRAMAALRVVFAVSVNVPPENV
jgi:hypothetical protein